MHFSRLQVYKLDSDQNSQDIMFPPPPAPGPTPRRYKPLPSIAGNISLPYYLPNADQLVVSVPDI